MSQNLLAQNALNDAWSVFENIDRKLVEADIVQYKEHGIDLELAARLWTSEYSGKISFMADMKSYVTRGKALTQGQTRAVLNIMRAEHLDKMGIPSGDQPALHLECFVCGDTFGTWDALLAHKSQEHGRASTVVEAPLEDGSESVAVIENTSSKLGIDLSNLPDGRYCAPDPSGKNDYIFLMVKRIRKTAERDRRYVYGTRPTGREVVLAGTIEVKEWSSDSKELIGEQKPGDTYRGAYEEQLSLIMMNPEAFGLLFGKLSGHCCICGKTLTDETSRAIGMGLDCERKESYWRGPKYSYVGRDRPDPEKMDKLDEERLARKGIKA